MTFLVERAAQLRKYLDHLYRIRGRVAGPHSLEQDLSLQNDVLFSLLSVCQLVVDIAGELSARRGLRFEDYTQAVRNLAAFEAFPAEEVERLARLPGFRNVLVHEYVALDLQQVVKALSELGPVESFLDRVLQLPEAK